MTLTGEQQSAANKYSRKIRNLEKRRYADRYIGYLMGNLKQPQDKDFNLSYMGMQAVRMELARICDELPPDHGECWPFGTDPKHSIKVSAPAS